MKKSLKLSLFLTAMFCWISNLQSQSWSAPNLDQNTYRNGNVAIGLTTPQAKLHLSKTTLEDVINIGDPIPTHPSYFPHIRFNNFVEKGGNVIGSNVWDINALNNFSIATIPSSGSNPSLKMSLSDQGNITFYGDRLAIGDGIIKLKTGKGNSLFGAAAYHIGFGISDAVPGANGTAYVFAGQGGSVIQGDADGNILFISKENDGDGTIGYFENLDYTSMILNAKRQVLIGTNNALDHPDSGQDYKLFVNGGMVSNEIKVENKMVIGTNNMPEYPESDYDYKLVVNGGMIAKEVKVRSDFADYVFEKDYNLLSLKEVESHIQEKGHLHNTPSAKNIQKNGLNVSEITTNQQEKIEELFLHLIEMEKRIEELEKENQALKSQILKK